MVSISQRDDDDRGDWIAESEGFWTAVWKAQADLGIDPLWPDREAGPASLGTSVVRRLARWPGVLDTVRDHQSRQALLRQMRLNVQSERGQWPAFLDHSVVRTAIVVVDQGLTMPDFPFVADCVQGGIEAYLFGRAGLFGRRPISDAALVRVAFVPRWVAGFDDPAMRLKDFEMQFAPHRVYLDVTDVPADRLEVEVASVRQEVVDVRTLFGLHEPTMAPKAGRPSLRPIAAYARALKDDERTKRTWKQVAEIVNDLAPRLGLTTEYNKDTIPRLVSRNDPL